MFASDAGAPRRADQADGNAVEHAMLHALGWDEGFDASWTALGRPGRPARVSRLDRGWSTAMRAPGEAEPLRLRNIGADVAVGDWIVPSDDDERVEHVIERRSAFVRRASFEGARAQSHTLASNVDVVFLLHSLTSPPNPRRLERELVLTFDSGAKPIVVLTKLDAVSDPEPTRLAVEAVALGVEVILASSRTGDGLANIHSHTQGRRTLALLGASGVGKSTLVNALVGRDVQRTGDVREGDDRGRHTTVASELVALPNGGWLVDTPGLRAVSLWSSGHGIERAFSDVFTLMDTCRFRDCKHEAEPGCAVQGAIADGSLDPIRLESMNRLVAEEARIEEEQREQLKAANYRKKPKRTSRNQIDDDEMERDDPTDPE